MLEFFDGIPDMINGVYELLGAPFIFLSILRLYKDKTICGVSYVTVLFFTTWSLWNLYYYSHLGQWGSFVGGIAIAFANLVWIVQIMYYMFLKKERVDKIKEEKPPLSETETKEIEKLIQDTVKHKGKATLKKIFSIGRPVIVEGRMFTVSNVCAHKLTLKMVSSKQKRKRKGR